MSETNTTETTAESTTSVSIETTVESTTEASEVSTETTSSWWKSKVLWAAVVAFGSAMSATVFGYTIDADTQATISNLITSIVSAF